MAFEVKENSGQLFKNNQKKQDNHPDYRGELNIEGEMWDMSAWLKESAKGNKYFSMSFRRQSDRPAAGGNYSPPAEPKRQEQFIPDVEDDDIPFS